MRIVKPEGREDFLSYSFALSHTWLRLIRARNRSRRPPRVSTILPFVPSKPSYRSALEDSSVRARPTRAIDKSKSLRHCALVRGRQLRRISSSLFDSWWQEKWQQVDKGFTTERDAINFFIGNRESFEYLRFEGNL